MKQGWEIKKLGEVADVGAGNSAPQKKELFENGNFPFFRTSDVGKIRKGFIDTSADYLNEKGVKGLKLFQKGTILFPKSGASTFLNHRVMMNVDGYVSSHLATIKAKSKIADDRFLLYYLITIDAKDLMQDIAYPSLKTSDIGLIPIPLPPLPEQKRIVSILDEAFAAIAKAKANAEQNLKNAKELFESYLQGVFENKGDGWEEKKLGEVLVKTETVDPTKNPDTEFTYLDVSSVNKETKEIETPTVLLGKDAPSRAKKMIRTGDVIFATVRPTHSRVALIPEEFDEQVCSTGYFVLRAKENVNNKLVFYFLLTKEFNEQMEKLQKGASYPAVTDNDVKGILFRFPKSKYEQQTIVRQLDALRAETQKLEAVYQKKIADLEELKKSILQKAFAVELSHKTIEV
jgi:type I restriction enzyme S subunit